MFILIFILWDMRDKNLKSKLELGFQCTVSPFSGQIWKENNMYVLQNMAPFRGQTVQNKVYTSCVAYLEYYF
jgi:hypothetical protein